MALKIGVSGKRNILENERQLVYDQMVEKVRSITKVKGNADFFGYTSLASGADLIFAEVVTKEFQKPLRIVLPFAMDAYRKDFSNLTEIGTIEKYIQDFGIENIMQHNEPLNNELRNDAYFNVGQFIVDCCDEMIIVWDELRPNGRGGTAEILGYRYVTKGVNSSEYIKVTPAIEDTLSIKIADEQQKSDEEAILLKLKYRNVWRQSIVLGLLVAFCFASKLLCHFEQYQCEPITEVWLTLAEFLVLLYIYIRVSFAKKKKIHSHYLSKRLKAEQLRVLKMCNKCNVNIDISNIKEHIESDILAIAEKVNSNPTKYISLWYNQMEILELIKEQLEYHQNRANKKIGKKPERWEKAAQIVGLFFLANSFAEIVIVEDKKFACDLPIQFLDSMHGFLIFLTIILPAIYASIEAFLHFNEWEQLKEYSKNASRLITRYESELPVLNVGMDTEIALSKQKIVLSRMFDIMLMDNVNWMLIFIDKSNYSLIV